MDILDIEIVKGFIRMCNDVGSQPLNSTKIQKDFCSF